MPDHTDVPMKGQRHVFEAVGFSILRPEGWISEPPIWARLAQEMQLQEVKALLEAVQKAAAPLFHFQKPHADPRQVIPTVQAVVRRKAPGPVDYANILASQAAQLETAIPGIEFLRKADDWEISGFRANLIAAMYALEWETHGETVTADILAWSVMVPTENFYFTLGLSSDTEEIHVTQAEMQGILASVRID